MKGLKFAAILLSLVFLIPVVAVTFFGGPIARSVVTSLNDRLQGEIRIERYEVAFWSTFPNLSVGLQHVEVAGSDGSELLAADRIDFLLDLGSLFGKIRVREVVVRDGQLQLLTDADGNTNYQLAGYTSVGERTAASDAPAEPTEFNIGEAIFQNVGVSYRDRQLNVDLAGRIDGLTFTGDFGTTNYLLSTDGSIFVDYLDQQGDRYVSRQQLIVTASTDIDNAVGVYTLAPLHLEVGDLELDVVGKLQPTKDGFQTDLRIDSESGSLADVIALIPPAYAGNLAELETRGELLLSATVRGPWTERAYPRIEGKLDFTDGRVGSPRVNVGVKDLDLRATFNYLDGPKGGVQTFSIDKLTGEFRRQPFSMTLLVEDTENPTVTFEADGAYALETLPALLGEGPITDGGGFLRAENIRITGKYKDMLTPRGMGRVRAEGRLRVDDAELTVRGRELNFPSGNLELLGNKMRLQQFAFSGPGTEITFTGEATNLIPVLFADSLNTNDAELIFDARLEGESLDLDELIALSGPTEAEEELAEAAGAVDSLRARTVSDRVRISDLLRGRFDARLEEWNYGEIEGKDFIGQLNFTPGRLGVAGVTVAMGGELRLDGDVFFTERLRVEGRVAGNRIDVKEFFEQGENFAQKVLTSDNLTGAMDAQLWIESAFDEAGEFDYGALRVLAHLTIIDGELHDFAMLENFAFALKSGDLERVRFTKLENYFEISDQTLYIPAMFIQSSALNMDLAGSHTFEQELDYAIKVNAGQAIANKLSRHDDELEVLPERQGWFNLYYTMKGPVETFAVEQDKRAVKAAFERSLLRRQRIERGLRSRFGG
ncbi:AsmA-like C-terminal region-containing protein [Neolewinella antarctica]|uniref:Cytoskeletal protein CcmA (Bactofilin family) n=1 Tax=Neolewinella antarctica TaxID=442734 RepID=A0ABX0XGG6_9BACT|nr:AsmA-like C-terminal region-containing protein [Neolewinella antarctica]NJC28421.1 cytoskeletal protein CcmA (bactofilin family) [Neolewinella antarctica]